MVWPFDRVKALQEVNWTVRKWIFAAVVVSTLAVLVYVKNSDAPEIAFVSQDSSMPRYKADDGSAPQMQVLPTVITGLDTAATDEHPITIRWYDHPARSFVFPSGSPMENYRYYRSLAESGNGLAAHQLANLMLGCRHSSFRTQEELDTATKQMKETFTYVDPTTKALVHLSEPDFGCGSAGIVRRGY